MSNNAKQTKQIIQTKQEEVICTNCGGHHLIQSCPYPRAPQR